MAFFRKGKKENESAYISQRKHGCDFISYREMNDCLVWKYPEETINNNASLIVGPMHEAVILDGRQIIHCFTTGTYCLNTQNYPFISRLRNLLSGGISSYSCQVYFINKAIPFSVDWKQKIAVPRETGCWYYHIGGETILKIDDAGLFLTGLMDRAVNIDQPAIHKYCSELVSENVSFDQQALKNNANIQLSDAGKKAIPATQSKLDHYGLKITCLNVKEFSMERTEGEECAVSKIQDKPLNIEIEPDNSDQYIFVSYAHKNVSAVMPVIQRMQKDGYAVWFDKSIIPGTEWDKTIAHKIINCTLFMSVITKEYPESSNCRDETHYARKLEKNRVLIYLDKVELPPEMEMRLDRLQAIHKYSFQNEDDFYAQLYTTEGIEQCRKKIKD